MKGELRGVVEEDGMEGAEGSSSGKSSAAFFFLRNPSIS
jgi:hypothetical protein